MQKKNMFLIFVPIAFLLIISTVSQSSDTVAEKSEKQGFVGAETCKGCHETQYATYAKTVHSKKFVKGPESQSACETCHGSGAKHVENGGGKGVEIFAFNKKTDANARSARCLVCHEEQKKQAFWNMSSHKAADVSCDDCHSPHKGGEKLLKGDRSEVCYRCHRDIKSQFNKQSHHPVKEGLVNCFDCHDPHGDFGNKMIKGDIVNELCVKCHAEKRGHFMWEHPPVEENCLNCHEPHGSSHSRLLVLKVPTLCQGCHDVLDHNTPLTSFSAFGGSAASGKNRFFGRACLNCHNNIHGGDGPVNVISNGSRFVR